MVVIVPCIQLHLLSPWLFLHILLTYPCGDERLCRVVWIRGYLLQLGSCFPGIGDCQEHVKCRIKYSTHSLFTIETRESLFDSTLQFGMEALYVFLHAYLLRKYIYVFSISALWHVFNLPRILSMNCITAASRHKEPSVTEVSDEKEYIYVYHFFAFL